MRCLDTKESKTWLRRHTLPTKPRSKVATLVGDIPKDITRLTWFSSFLANTSPGFETCLMWVTEWGIWPSSENLHLFYRLRQTYSEHRLLHESPGHLFLKHESADLASFIAVAVLCGWGFHLHPSPGPIRGFVSHDEWFKLEANDDARLLGAKELLAKAQVDFKLQRERSHD